MSVNPRRDETPGACRRAEIDRLLHETLDAEAAGEHAAARVFARALARLDPASTTTLRETRKALASLDKPITGAPDLSAAILARTHEARPFLTRRTRRRVSVRRLGVGLAVVLLLAGVALVQRLFPEAMEVSPQPRPVSALAQATQADVADGLANLERSFATLREQLVSPASHWIASAPRTGFDLAPTSDAAPVFASRGMLPRATARLAMGDISAYERLPGVGSGALSIPTDLASAAPKLSPGQVTRGSEPQFMQFPVLAAADSAATWLDLAMARAAQQRDREVVLMTPLVPASATVVREAPRTPRTVQWQGLTILVPQGNEGAIVLPPGVEHDTLR
jgi:hypothetical protein